MRRSLFRTSWVCLILVALPLMQPAQANSQESKFYARVYLSEREAIQLQKQPRDRVVHDTIVLSDSTVKRIRKQRRVGMYTDSYRVYKLYRPGEDTPYRYAVFLQQPGQHEFIDLMYGVNRDGSIHRIDLLVYREPYGGEVRSRRFMAQFEGHTLENSQFRVNMDIIHIVGATISSKSVARGARKVLVILHSQDLTQGDTR